MRYMGSKRRYARHIMPFLMKGHDPARYYVEPFVGGGNMLAYCPAPRRWGNDTARYAVALLAAIADGWHPPEEVSEKLYADIRENPEEYPNHMVGFAMYCCSYAGKPWGGYWRSPGRNGAAEQSRHLIKQAKDLSGVHWTTRPYDNLILPKDCTVYCDPPYAGATGYQGVFDPEQFWGWCAFQSNRGCRVFVSEYTAPPGWHPIWQKEVTNSLTKDTGAKRGVEALWVPMGQAATATESPL